MQCECKSDLEKRLKAKVLEQLPEGARNFDGQLEGYRFAMNDTGLLMFPALDFAVEFEQPKKRGEGYAKKKQRFPIAANFCPFCGKAVKLEKKEQANG